MCTESFLISLFHDIIGLLVFKCLDNFNQFIPLKYKKNLHKTKKSFTPRFQQKINSPQLGQFWTVHLPFLQGRQRVPTMHTSLNPSKLVRLKLAALDYEFSCPKSCYELVLIIVKDQFIHELFNATYQQGPVILQPLMTL